MKNESKNWGKFLRDSGSFNYTVSVDEKPGVQAVGLTAPDLPPVPGKVSAIGRNYEYVRHGMVSIIAGIDLHTQDTSLPMLKTGIAV